MFCGMVQNKPLEILVYSIVQGAVVAKGSLRQWVSRCRFLSEGEAAPTVVLGAGPPCEDSASRRTRPRCSTSLWRAPPCRTQGELLTRETPPPWAQVVLSLEMTPPWAHASSVLLEARCR